ncbi:MAG: glycosyltransferase family 39 protein [bacterium]
MQPVISDRTFLEAAKDGRRPPAAAVWILLAGILALAGFLRFHDLRTREPRISDEADYLMEAQWVSSLTHALLDSLSLYREERASGRDLWKKEEQLQAIRDALAGHPPYLGRPGHVLLIALSMQGRGDPMLAGARVSALFGLLTVPVLFLLAGRLYGARTALLAALLLALSACHVWYSRTGFAEADTTFFVVLTFYLYVLSASRRSLSLFAATGFTAGLGFLVHHRFILFLGALWLFEIARLVRSGPRAGSRARRLAPLLASSVFFTLPLLALESVYHLAFIALQALGRPLPCPTYFSQLLMILGYIRVNNLIPYAHFFTWDNWLTYPYLFRFFEGPLFCVLLAGGIAVLALRRRWQEGMVALLFLGPLAFYSLQNAEARFMCASVPFAALACAVLMDRGLAWSGRKGLRGRRAAWLLVALVLCFQGGIAWRRVGAHDRLSAAYRSTAEYLRASGSPNTVSVYPHPFRLYLGAAHVAVPPGSEEELRQLCEQGFRTVVIVDFMDYYVRRFEAPELEQRLPRLRSLSASRTVMQKVDEALSPVFEAPCEFCSSPLNIFEINLNFRKSLAFVAEGSENTADKIRVYSLADYFAQASAGAATSRETRVAEESLPTAGGHRKDSPCR